MHSSTLRGSDFEMIAAGRGEKHATYFRDYSNTHRLGVVSPERVDGVGAMNLVMAHVTAFYDVYRSQGDSFFAYPDYFSFQSQIPVAEYTMLDIYPQHKWVSVSDDPCDRLDAITDRGVNILILPEAVPGDRAYDKIQLASAQRNILACYVYAFDGHVEGADVVIRCKKEPLFGWAQSVFQSLESDAQIGQRKSEWESFYTHSETIEQSYRRVSLDTALAML